MPSTCYKLSMAQKKRVLLLENIHPLARDLFVQAGCEVELLKAALGPEELKEKLKSFNVLGIRSKTQVTADVLEAAKHIETIGCFCVGTNQVNLEKANGLGIPVFNAPFSNTRSVAEMVIAEIVMLSRQLGTRNNEMHRAVWNKKSDHCYEVRGKTLGIVGYGNIGTQVSHLAEALGMRVVFYDIVSKLPLGNAKPMPSLPDLLKESDVVTFHVPETPYTHEMVGEEEIEAMKPGAFLINASRGRVVKIDQLAAALKSGRLGGAAIDVFPVEPEGNTQDFKTPLQGLPNVVLTPHIGGATEEAQGNIGREVAALLITFMREGSTQMCVNFPRIDLTQDPKNHRLINIHKNVPGVLKDINRIISESGANIQAQALSTDAHIGYLIIDLDQPIQDKMIKDIDQLKTSLRTRVI